MLDEIVNYLYSFKDEEYHVLNDFLSEKFPTVQLCIIRENISILVQAKRIDNENNTFKKLDNYSRINNNDYQNTYRDLRNLIVKAKLSPDEKEKMKNKERDRQAQGMHVTISGNQNIVPIQSTGEIKQENYNKDDNKKKDFWEKPLVKGILIPIIVAFVIWISSKIYENYQNSHPMQEKELIKPNSTKK